MYLGNFCDISSCVAMPRNNNTTLKYLSTLRLSIFNNYKANIVSQLVYLFCLSEFESSNNTSDGNALTSNRCIPCPIPHRHVIRSSKHYSLYRLVSSGYSDCFLHKRNIDANENDLYRLKLLMSINNCNVKLLIYKIKSYVYLLTGCFKCVNNLVQLPRITTCKTAL